LLRLLAAVCGGSVFLFLLIMWADVFLRQATFFNALGKGGYVTLYAAAVAIAGACAPQGRVPIAIHDGRGIDHPDEIPGASSRIAVVALIPSAVAFNIALAQIVLWLKLPLYLDCVGIITTTLIAGLIPGLIVTALAFSMMALLFNNIIICFTGTAAFMAVLTHLLANVSWFKTIPRTIGSGLILGIVSALISMPISVKLFGGVTTAGSTFVTAWFIHRGYSLWMAAFLSGFICDALLDKSLEALLAVWLIRAVPRDLLIRFNGPTLARNFNLSE